MKRISQLFCGAAVALLAVSAASHVLTRLLRCDLMRLLRCEESARRSRNFAMSARTLLAPSHNR